jgi:hypothetical protein
MQFPEMLKSNLFRDFATGHAARQAQADKFECSRCHEHVPTAKRGAAPQMLVLSASLLSDVTHTTGDFCSSCARNIDLLGAFGMLLLIGQLAIVLADVKKYF